MNQTPSRRGTQMQTTIPKDRIPLLSITEIAECLSIFNINASEHDLNKPTPEIMQFLYRHILDDVFMVTNVKVQDVIDKVLKTTQERRKDQAEEEEEEDIRGENTDSLSLLVLNRLLFKHLTKCGIDDFSLSDLIRPDLIRNKRILSAVINYTRFQMEHADDNLDFLQTNEEIIMKLRSTQEENLKIKQEYNKLYSKLQRSTDKIGKLNQDISQLEMEFRERRKQQEIVSRDHDAYRTEKSKLLKELEDDTYIMDNKETELRKWKSKYQLDSPQKLKRLLEGLLERLNEEQVQNTEISTNITKLTISTNTFHDLIINLQTIIKQTEDILIDLQKFQTGTRQLSKLELELHSKQLKLTEREHQIQLSQRAIKSLEERHSRIMEQYERRKNSFQIKNQQLDSEFIKLRNQSESLDPKLKNQENYILIKNQEIIEMNDFLNKINLDIGKSLEELEIIINNYVDKLSEKVDI